VNTQWRVKLLHSCRLWFSFEVGVALPYILICFGSAQTQVSVLLAFSMSNKLSFEFVVRLLFLVLDVIMNLVCTFCFKISYTTT
jgi:hypothetical protein